LSQNYYPMRELDERDWPDVIANSRKHQSGFGIILAIYALSCFAELPERPNILLIVADDMAYTDIGAYGGDILTPILDRLAAEGITFSRFYAVPTCSPTRSMLMSGTDNHIAGIGTMAGLDHARK
jgi:hypothetical protein